jgi:hypothetical protein
LEAFNAIEGFAAGINWIGDLFGGGEDKPGRAPTGAAAVAGGGGGDTALTETEQWPAGQSAGGATVVNNFNTQITRSDAVAIAAESDRMDYRQ